MDSGAGALLSGTVPNVRRVLGRDDVLLYPVKSESGLDSQGAHGPFGSAKSAVGGPRRDAGALGPTSHTEKSPSPRRRRGRRIRTPAARVASHNGNRRYLLAFRPRADGPVGWSRNTIIHLHREHPHGHSEEQPRAVDPAPAPRT